MEQRFFIAYVSWHRKMAITMFLHELCSLELSKLISSHLCGRVLCTQYVGMAVSCPWCFLSFQRSWMRQLIWNGMSIHHGCHHACWFMFCTSDWVRLEPSEIFSPWGGIGMTFLDEKSLKKWPLKLLPPKRVIPKFWDRVPLWESLATMCQGLCSVKSWMAVS